jgi:acetyltransferase-like isoleucine patch superfamily enzyme
MAVDGSAAPEECAGSSWSSTFARAWSVLGEEFVQLHPRLLIAGLAIRLLPQLAFQRLRTALYRMAGVSIGRHSLVAGRMELIGRGPIAKRFTVGSGCWLNSPLFVDLTGRVVIGNDVTIGHHVTFITSDHEIGPPRHRCGAVSPSQVVIEDGVWIGAGVMLLPGARVGAGTVVGAESLVVGTLPPGIIAMGRPARAVRSADDPPWAEVMTPRGVVLPMVVDPVPRELGTTAKV